MSSDSAPLAPAPVTGAPIVVLRRGSPSGEVCGGVFVGQQAFNVTLDLGSPEAVPEPGQDVILAAGPVGKRVVLLARFRELRGARAIFLRQSPWRPVDARLFPRYRTAIAATVELGGECHPGRIIDISKGGAALEIDCDADCEQPDVVFWLDDVPDGLPCRVVNREREPGHLVLHLQFEGLSNTASLHVQHLVERLGAEVEAGLLAS
ncbi:MAG: PilZ domain-containing protein [Dehalococcoidia bacterium]|nr:PilZ domain-containing protein [Dehalococcoidia bacterium]